MPKLVTIAGLPGGCCCPTISRMAADAFIRCRVTAATKRALRVVADRQNISESALLKRFVDLAVQGVVDQPPLPKPEPLTRDARLSVRLRLIDQRLLKERAATRGLASATYVSLLVRSHLHGVAPLPKEETKGLQRCLIELAAMRRYLQLLTQLALEKGKPAEPGSQEIMAIATVLEATHRRTKSLLESNFKSWQSGDGR